MTREELDKLDKLTKEFRTDMDKRVNKHIPEKIDNDLKKSYERFKLEIVTIDSNIFEKYKDRIELNPMGKEINESNENIIQEISKRIQYAKREIEKDKNIDTIKAQITKNDKAENQDAQGKKYLKTRRVKDILNDALRKLEIDIRKKEPNIDWEYCKNRFGRISSNYAEDIQQNVFTKNENQIINKEIENYIEVIRQELIKDKSKDEEKLTFEEGPVCPVVTNREVLDAKNSEVVKKCTAEQSKEPKRSLPSNVLE